MSGWIQAAMQQNTNILGLRFSLLVRAIKAFRDFEATFFIELQTNKAELLQVSIFFPHLFICTRSLERIFEIVQENTLKYSKLIHF